MKCYQCGNRLTADNYCPACGVDVSIYKKIMAMSNYMYNDGLNKARARDLSGAAASLKQSLKYNKRNIDARNLLGLVYFETGEVVLALSEWIISKNFEKTENIASEYIDILQSSPSKLEEISSTLKKYNQALRYCSQDSKDLAIIQLKKLLSTNKNLIKGYQLLALLYICTEDYDNARKTLFKALSVDASNTTTLYYVKEVNSLVRELEEKSGRKHIMSPIDTVSYYNGSDVVIQPIYQKEKAGLSSVINILIGLFVGVAICGFLILPTRVSNKSEQNDERFKSVSEELASEQALNAEMKQSVEAITEERDKLQKKVDDLTGASGKMTENDYLMDAAASYVSDPTNSVVIMEKMSPIEETYLEQAPESFKLLYDALMKDAGELATGEYVQKARDAVKANDYNTAIEEYTKAWLLDKSNSDVLMSLAHCYRQSGDTEKADELYTQVIDTFPETQNAIDAMEYMSEDE